MAITDAPPAAWGDEEINSLKAEYPELMGSQNDAVSKYNPTPGLCRRHANFNGFVRVKINTTW